MSIERITAEDLRRMEDKEGLILQGCGGDPQEWLDGINNMFSENGILLNGSKFENIQVFQKDGSINILYPFEDVQLNLGKLAMWRLASHGTFGGTWLSDYVPNSLGGFLSAEPQVPQKPNCALIGQDGNIFNLVGIASRTLREHGQREQAMELTRRVFASDSYGKALSIIGEYVNITSVDDPVRPSVRNQLKDTAQESSKPTAGRKTKEMER